MRFWGTVAMAILMMAWAAFNLIARPGHRTGWYIAGAVVAVLIVVAETIERRSR